MTEPDSAPDADHEARRRTRMAFAETLSEFNDQRSWYSRKAGTFKERSQRLDIAIICFGALIAIMPVLKPGSAPHWTVIAASILGALVAIFQGVQRVFRYGEIWPEYRLASERMKREWRLFVNAADGYDCDTAEAQRRYVARLEQIIAEEQKIFFERSRSNDKTETGETSDAQ